MSIYRFPAIDGLEEITPDYQFHKIVEEVKEVKLAKWSLSLEVHSPESTVEKTGELLEELGIELLDVIHACETMLRMSFDDEEVEGLRAKVIEKNARRGYYKDARQER